MGAVYECRCLAVLGFVKSGAAIRLLDLQASSSGRQGCRLPCSYQGVTDASNTVVGGLGPILQCLDQLLQPKTRHLLQETLTLATGNAT